MKIEELRIGLWVYLFGDAVQLTADHLVYLYARNSTPEPITLTEEWLKRFGETYVNGYRLEIINGSAFIDETQVIAENIAYVHQLQNLYHALTGKELTLSPPQL